MLGISFDSREENAAFAEAQGFPFPLLCDTQREVGLAYRACENRDQSHPWRITYVIGADGRIERAIATRDPAGQAAELLGELA